MSSFNTHKRKVEDISQPIEHRYSHARSCLNKVANLMGLTRAELVDQIELKSGINLESSKSESDLEIGFKCLILLRASHLKT